MLPVSDGGRSSASADGSRRCTLPARPSASRRAGGSSREAGSTPLAGARLSLASRLESRTAAVPVSTANRPASAVRPSEIVAAIAGTPSAIASGSVAIAWNGGARPRQRRTRQGAKRTSTT